MKVLLVAEGSGGHLIPALQVARTLAEYGVQSKVWYAQRSHLAPLAHALAEEMGGVRVDVNPIPVVSSQGLGRLWQCGRLWRQAQRCLEAFAPDVVVGFGGWTSAPVLLAAYLRRTLPLAGFGGAAARRRWIGCVVHEQNVAMGRTNRLLACWADRVAVSFPETRDGWLGASAVLTGLPIRRGIGEPSRSTAARQLDMHPERPTVLVLGGSQGARAINRLMIQATPLLSSEERDAWQILHLTGLADEAAVREAYAAEGVTARVAPFLLEMGAAYALADVVIARAGASTIAELARCGTPAILIPYPHANGHQLANARVVEAIGGGLVMEEPEATAARLVGSVRRLLADRRLRILMGAQLRALDCADAAERLSRTIVEAAQPSLRASHTRVRHSECGVRSGLSIHSASRIPLGFETSSRQGTSLEPSTMNLERRSD